MVKDDLKLKGKVFHAFYTPNGKFKMEHYIQDELQELTKKFPEENIRSEVRDLLNRINNISKEAGYTEEEIQERESYIDKLIPPGINTTEKRIKNIKNTSRKLSNKTFKLKEAVKSISKELLNFPPSYNTDGYKVILTSDINETNVNAFIARFRAGRVIAYGRVADSMNEFAKELVLKTISYNKLSLDNNFFFVIYENMR